MIEKYVQYGNSLVRLLRHRICNTSAPLFAALSITGKCNYKCVYCYGNYMNEQKESFTTDELVKIIDDLHAMGTLIVNLIGGEPLLRNDVQQLVNRVKDLGMACHLSSNASLVPEKIREIGGIDVLDTSLDGLEVSNDMTRGKGSFKRTLLGIKCAIDHGIKTNVNMVLTRNNLADIDPMVAMAIETGFSMSFNIGFESHSREFENFDDSVAVKSSDDAAVKQGLIKILAHKKNGAPIRFLASAYRYALNWPLPYNQSLSVTSSDRLGDFKPLYCYFPRFHCYIDSDGRMYNCMHLKDRHQVIKVQEYGVKGAWKKSCACTPGCLACYVVCNNNANLIFGLSPGTALATLIDAVRSKL